jgi:hypothetical protein
MREAADMLSAPSAMQIRYLETLSSLSKAPRTKIIFLPSDSSSSNQPSIQTNNGVRLVNPAQSQNFLSN